MKGPERMGGLCLIAASRGQCCLTPGAPQRLRRNPGGLSQAGLALPLGPGWTRRSWGLHVAGRPPREAAHGLPWVLWSVHVEGSMWRVEMLNGQARRHAE